MGIAKSGIERRAVRTSVCGLIGLALVSVAAAQEKGSQEKVIPAAARFAGRVESLLGAAPVDKGEWGLLVVDAETGVALYEKNANDY
ncbi:MAG TPA: hypothetical protein VNH19_16935, partial [Candidatus Limnocylindrales bacterium]|nr:hypothetical protein [Candidatus Limnocylindrales bacterium]